MSMTAIEILSTFATAIITALVTLAATRITTRNNSTVARENNLPDLLEQLNEYLNKNSDLNDKNVSLNKQLSDLRQDNERLSEQIEALKHQNEELSKQLSLITEQLKGQKTS